MAKLEGTAGNDLIRGTHRVDKIEGKGGDDIIYGFRGADILKGDEGNDTIYGGLGSDVVHGDEGNDTLFGHGGNDLIDGGEGNDRMTGGAGRDIFEFGDVASGDDIITDFRNGVDRIEFDLDNVNSMRDIDISGVNGTDTLITWDGGSIQLLGFNPSLLGPEDFLF